MHPFNNVMMQGRSITPEAEALIARFSTPPTNLRRYLINRMVRRLKDCGAWALIEILWVLAAADSQAARLNWKGTANPATAVGSPAFTADRGYMLGDAAYYLSSGAITSSSGNTNRAMGLWCNSFAFNGAAESMGTGFTVDSIRCYNSGGNGAQFYPQRTTTVFVSAMDGLGMRAMSRTGANAWSSMIGASVANHTDAQNSGASSLLIVGGSAFGGSPTISNDILRPGVVFFGQGLTDAQLTAVRFAFNEYLTAVGGA